MDAERLRTESRRIVGLMVTYVLLRERPTTEQELDEFVDGAIRATTPLFIGDAEQLKEAIEFSIVLLLGFRLAGERLN